MPPELPLTKPAWESDVQASQSDYFAQHGKYQRFGKDAIATDSEVHEYVGPDGAGYLTFEYFKKGEETYVRTTNVGPETWHQSDWVLKEK